MRPLARALAIAFVVAVAAPLHDVAAQAAELQVGAKLRLRAPGTVAGRIEGTVIARGRDSVTITASRTAPIVVPIMAITEASVSRGRSHTTGAWKGFLWGTGVGAALGLLGALGNEDCDPASDADCVDWSSDDVALMAGFSGALGAAIGSVIGAERWERLEFPARMALGASPRRLAIGAVVPF